MNDLDYRIFLERLTALSNKKDLCLAITTSPSDPLVVNFFYIPYHGGKCSDVIRMYYRHDMDLDGLFDDLSKLADEFKSKQVRTD